MFDELKHKIADEMKDISKDGVKTGNIEYIAKLAETYKNLNKSEKEELETMIYDDRLDRRYDRGRMYGDEYPERYSRGRGEYARRDSKGRYADGRITPIEDGYQDYIGAKRRYRAGSADPAELFDGLEMIMKHITMLIEDLAKECDQEEERRIIDKYIKRISDIR